jgi:hypothetical protein
MIDMTQYLFDNYARPFSKELEKQLKLRNETKVKEIVDETLRMYNGYCRSFNIDDESLMFEYLFVFSAISCCMTLEKYGYTREESIAIYEETPSIKFRTDSIGSFLINLLDEILTFKKVRKIIHRLTPSTYKKEVNDLKKEIEGNEEIIKTEIINDNKECFEFKVNKCLYVDICERFERTDLAYLNCPFSYDDLSDNKHINFKYKKNCRKGDYCTACVSKKSQKLINL